MQFAIILASLRDPVERWFKDFKSKDPCSKNTGPLGDILGPVLLPLRGIVGLLISLTVFRNADLTFESRKNFFLDSQ